MPRRLKNPRAKNQKKAKLLQDFMDGCKEQLDDVIIDFISNESQYRDISDDEMHYMASVLRDALFARFPKEEGREVEETDSHFTKKCSCGETCDVHNSVFKGVQEVSDRIKKSKKIRGYELWNCKNCDSTFSVELKEIE